jgi:NADPH-dependent 2,4-dienoyl-CoA reductase/sulfur reductase-like enzyme
MFGVKKYADLLEQHRIRRGVGVQYMQELVSVDGEAHTAVFKCLSDGTLSTQTFDVLHVTPPMSAPDFLKRSPLADAGGTGGWMAVDKHTLQSTKYDNVFGLGDTLQYLQYLLNPPFLCYMSLTPTPYTPIKPTLYTILVY